MANADSGAPAIAMNHYGSRGEIQDEDGIEALSPRIRLLIEDLRAEWRALDERIAVFDKEFVQMARNEEPVRRLVTIPGIGTIK